MLQHIKSCYLKIFVDNCLFFKDQHLFSNKIRYLTESIHLQQGNKNDTKISLENTQIYVEKKYKWDFGKSVIVLIVIYIRCIQSVNHLFIVLPTVFLFILLLLKHNFTNHMLLILWLKTTNITDLSYYSWGDPSLGAKYSFVPTVFLFFIFFYLLQEIRKKIWNVYSGSAAAYFRVS